MAEGVTWHTPNLVIAKRDLCFDAAIQCALAAKDVLLGPGIWIAAGYAFAMMTKMTRHAPKLSLRGETFVSTRQSICALANSIALLVDRRRYPYIFAMNQWA